METFEEVKKTTGQLFELMSNVITNPAVSTPSRIKIFFMNELGASTELPKDVMDRVPEHHKGMCALAAEISVGRRVPSILRDGLTAAITLWAKLIIEFYLKNDMDLTQVRLIVSKSEDEVIHKFNSLDPLFDGLEGIADGE